MNGVEAPVEYLSEFDKNPKAYFCKTYAKLVTIGNNFWIGAGASVTQYFPDDCLVGGVPARVLKQHRKVKRMVLFQMGSL